ncbi:YceD family protein [Methylococcus sp. EFPC2]|uniref:YceD family protein n=1 Tax=Methylococcus sp. EFPC2 TaxID=2812648 RepID=UPI00196804E8|nr:YceD family protein [Methylococcus sp. EFPC2]QSA97387.1 DUF177 domain-containing protein [Methylococcus sp. EFPC2]
MFDHLPEFVDPTVMAEKQRRFSGALPFARMARLVDAVANRDGSAAFELGFAKEGRHVTVTGRVRAELALICQCCLAPMSVNVDVAVSLAVARTVDEANLLPERYEALMLEDDKVSLVELVEDELLLAVPSVPQHESCVSAIQKAQEPEPAPPVEARKNPFAVLAELKKTH